MKKKKIIKHIVISTFQFCQQYIKFANVSMPL